MNRLQPRERVLYSATCSAIALEQRYQLAREAGFTAVSLFTTDIDEAMSRGLALADIRQMIANAGLKLASLEIVGNWIDGQTSDCDLIPPGMAEMLLSRTPAQVCEMAAELGAQSITVADLFGLPFDGPKVGSAFATVCHIAADFDLDIVLEFIPSGCVATIAQAREVVERADHPRAGILLDNWHFFRGGSQLEELANLPGELVGAWQTCDTSQQPTDPQIFKDMTTRVMPGDGELDLPGFMQAIAATGTTAPGGIEVFDQGMAEWSAQQTVNRAAEALDYCLDLSGENG